MKETAFVPKGKEREFLEQLRKKALVYAPYEEKGVVSFEVFDPNKTPCLDKPANTSPKSVIFPQNEILFSFEKAKNPEDPKVTSIELSVKPDVPETIIFGNRPCDARGLTILDPVYISDDIQDPYYRERRKKTAFVTLACSEPYTACFCVGVGGGPADKTGSDIIMTDVGEGYFLEALTDKGKEILSATDVKEGDSYKDEAKKRQEESHGKVNNPFEGKEIPKGSTDIFTIDEFWEAVTERCISCGACTYVCPTCYCFNITDEAVAGKGQRIRSWDACMFHHFTLEGSGHNPRPLKQHRYRNRVGHKFFYYPEKYNGVIACTGCGRCIRYCPVSINISEIVSKATDVLQEQKNKRGQNE